MDVIYQQALRELEQAEIFFQEATGKLMIDAAVHRLNYARANFEAVYREMQGERGQVA